MNLPFDNGSLECLLRAGKANRIEMCPGLTRETLTYGDGVMLCLFRFAKGAVLPKHHHAHEQAGYVIQGAIEFTIGESTFVMRAGDSYIARTNQPHCGFALEASVVLDAFSPVREDYVGT